MTDSERRQEAFHATTGKKQCPQCGSVLTLKSYGGHMRKAHGVYGGFSGRIRNDKRYNRPDRQPNQGRGRGKSQQIMMPERHFPARPAPAPPIPNGLAPGTLVTVAFNDKLRAGLGEDGSVWICEKVRDGRPGD